MKKKRFKPSILIIIPIVIATTYGILFYFNFFQGSVMVDNDTIISSNLPDDNFHSKYTSSINFNDISAYKISNDVSIYFFNTELTDINIYEKCQRYYLPLTKICSTLNYEIINDNDSLIIKKDDRIINLSTDSCLINNENYSLRGHILVEDGEKYISISDIEYLFQLTATFDFDNNKISFFNTLSSTEIPNSNSTTSGRAALLRLEDFSAGYGTLNSENQLKYKAIGKFLESNTVKFHIAWVPRFKCPSDNIDNDLLVNTNLENIGFINTLDYLINCGAEIGLHGYTHQINDETSLNGTELSYKFNTSEKDTRSVIENAIDTATYLNIPYNFFESPHYKATKKQKKIIEEYFQYLYEPKNIFIYNKLAKNNNNLYIPTPLGYVHNLDVTNIEKNLTSPKPNQLASFFYHPALELDYINVNIVSDNIELKYDTSSPLYKLVKALKDNNYVNIYVTDLKNNN